MNISSKLPNGITVRQTTESCETWGDAKKVSVEIKLDEELKRAYPELYSVGIKQDEAPEFPRSQIVRGRRGDQMDGYLSPDEMRPKRNPIFFGVKAAKQYEEVIELGAQSLQPKIADAARQEKFEVGRAKAYLELKIAREKLTETLGGEPAEYLTRDELQTFEGSINEAMDSLEPFDPKSVRILSPFFKLTDEQKIKRALVVASIDSAIDTISDTSEPISVVDLVGGAPIKVPGKTD